MKTLFTLALGFILAATALAGTNDPVAAVAGDEMRTCVVNIDAKAFLEKARAHLTTKSGESTQDFVVRYFKEKGVDIQDPEKVFLNEQKGKLIIHGPLSKIDQIEHL